MNIIKNKKKSFQKKQKSNRDIKRMEELILNLLSTIKSDFEKFDKKLSPIRNQFGDAVYSKFLFLITQLEFASKEAQKHYEKIKIHHTKLKEKLQREIDIRVAVADYFVSNKQIKEPMVLEIHLFKKAFEAGIKDTLTDLHNYTFFKGAFPHELAHCKRYFQPLSVIFFDIDDFKKINDEYGHEEANLCLKETGTIIKRCLREMDIPFRYGGEEFLILLPKTDKFGALAVAERIRKKISETKFAQSKIQVTLSGGIASFPVDDSEGNSIVSKADEAMYRAKAKGKNRVELYSYEKRAYERVEDKFKGVVSFNKITSQVLGKNLSISGFYIETKKKIPPSTPISFVIDFPQNEQIKGEGYITRMEPHPEKKYGLGVTVTSIANKDKELLKLIITKKKKSSLQHH